MFLQLIRDGLISLKSLPSGALLAASLAPQIIAPIVHQAKVNKTFDRQEEHLEVLYREEPSKAERDFPLLHEVEREVGDERPYVLPADPVAAGPSRSIASLAPDLGGQAPALAPSVPSSTPGTPSAPPSAAPSSSEPPVGAGPQGQGQPAAAPAYGVSGRPAPVSSQASSKPSAAKQAPVLSENKVGAAVSTESTNNNAVPVAGNDNYVTSINAALVIQIPQILANDTDANGDALTLTAFQAASANLGTVTRSGNELTYTPAVGYTGQDSFTYTASDGSKAGIGTITINVLNGVPITMEESQTAKADNSSSIVSPSMTADVDQLYVAVVAYTDSDNSVTGVSGLGLVWTHLEDQCSNRGAVRVEVWYATGSPAASGVITANLNAVSDGVVIAAQRFSEVDLADPLAVLSTANPLGENGTATCGSPGTDQRNISYQAISSVTEGVLFAVTAFEKSGNFLTPVSLNETAESGVAGDNPNFVNLSLQEYFVAVPGAHSVDGTLDRSANWAGIALEIKKRP